MHADTSRPIVGGAALAQARALWCDAVAQDLPHDRFRLAHLAALRATAALLAARAVGPGQSVEPGRSVGLGRSSVHRWSGPRAGRAGRSGHRPTSAWVLLSRIAPEFGDWADYFAAGARVRAAADAGVVGAVGVVEAAEVVEAVRIYLAAVHTDLVLARGGAPPAVTASAGCGRDDGGSTGVATVLAFVAGHCPPPPPPRHSGVARAS